MTASDTKTSPMMSQWHACKQNAKDALLLFRLGDFYEAFYEDALILAKELDLTLTKRQEIPMAGVPVHTCEGYIDKLVAKGLRIAIAEQLEDPKATKGLVKRDIVRIVTPGTVVNSSLLSDKTNNFIASLHQVNQILGLAILDITTADFRVFEFEEKETLLDELTRLRPKEILISSKCLHYQQDLIDSLKEHYSFAMVTKEEWLFDLRITSDFLKRHFDVHSLDGFGLKSQLGATSAAGALLSYVQDELNISIQHIQSIKKESLSQYMSLDSATQRHLELVESLHDKQSDYTLLHLLDQTATPMGARLLKHWLLHPLLQVSDIGKRQNAVESLIHFDKRDSLLDSLEQVRDLERLIMRIETGFASPRDLLGLALSLEQVPTVTSLLSSSTDPLLQSNIDLLSDVSPLVFKIKNALVEEPPFRLSDGNIFRSGYHPELDELRAIKTDSHTWMAHYQTKLKEETGIKTLKVGYTKAFGYYIEISRGQSEKIPSHFERRQTLVNAERCITPELKTFEHKVLSAEDRIAALENELFQALRKEISSFSADIRKIASSLASIDSILSLAKVAIRHHFVKPLIDEKDTFYVEAGRHPVIEASLKSESFIPNDVFLDQDKQRLFVITGPNMAGKSTFIRQVALIAIMAQMGSFVPAQKAHIGIIDKVFSRIGASDNLAKGQSTFMVEMTETANILNNVTSKSLVILDEIGRGTSTYDGISIAWAVAEYLLTTPGKTPKTLFATHYCELTELEEKIPGAINYNIAVHETEKGIIFLRKIVRGGTDKSYGIHVARLAGLPLVVIKKAKEILKSLEDKDVTKPSSSRKKKDQDQLNLFTSLPPTEMDTIAKEISSIDPNQLTPIEALKKLIEWKEKLPFNR